MAKCWHRDKTQRGTACYSALFRPISRPVRRLLVDTGRGLCSVLTTHCKYQRLPALLGCIPGEKVQRDAAVQLCCCALWEATESTARNVESHRTDGQCPARAACSQKHRASSGLQDLQSNAAATLAGPAMNRVSCCLVKVWQLFTNSWGIKFLCVWETERRGQALSEKKSGVKPL